MSRTKQRPEEGGASLHLDDMGRHGRTGKELREAELLVCAIDHGVVLSGGDHGEIARTDDRRLADEGDED